MRRCAIKFPVAIYPGDDGMYIAKCSILPGCAKQGKTIEEVLENTKEAIACCVEVRKKMGWPPAEEIMK